MKASRRKNLQSVSGTDKIKSTLIADFIHGNIPITRFEKRLVSTEDFNRLHDVLQGSMSYLTFPSARYSRFSHSLGAMNFAGQIWKSAYSNSSTGTQRRIIRLIRSILKRYIDQHTDEFEECIDGETEKNDILRENKFIKKKSLFPQMIAEIFDVVPENYNQAFIRAVIHQAVRSSALLHDIGHPPMSHVTEKALERFHSFLLEKKDLILSKHFQHFKAIAEKEFDSDIPLHEALTIKISKALFKRIISNIKTEIININKDVRNSTLVYLKLVYYLSLDILSFRLKKEDHKLPSGLEIDQNDKSVLNLLHNVMSSTIDADRLDFTLRDNKLTGVNSYNFPRERFLRSVKIDKIKIESNDYYDIVYNARIVDIIENLLQARFDHYRYVVSHHRVLKMNLLLKIVIRRSLQAKVLTKNKQSSKKYSEFAKSNYLPSIPEAIVAPVIQCFRGNFEYYDMLYQWSDSWLVTMLRAEFHRLKPDFDKNRLKKNEKRYYEELLELITNRKIYISLIKRKESFRKLEKKVHEKIKDKLKTIKEKEYLRHIRGQINTYNKRGFSLFDAFEFAFNAIRHSIRHRDATLFKELKNITFRTILEELKNADVKHNIRILAERRFLNSGIDTKPWFYDDGSPFEMNEVSSKHDYLKSSINDVPGFFLYTKPEKSQTRPVEKALEVSIEAIANAYERLINELERIIKDFST